MEPWAELSLFESRDLVERKFRERHERYLSAEKAREIVSAVAQSREFFRSAAAAADLVRPLLLYYGVLTLSRALILFLQPAHREATLKPSHGLSAVEWGQHLSSGVQNLPTLRIRFEGGTLSELAEATHNRERTLIWVAPYPNRGLFSQEGSITYPSGFELTAKDVLGRLPDIAPLYEEIFAELPSCMPAFVFHLSASTHTDVDVFPLNGRLITEGDLRQTFGLNDVTEFRQATQHNFKRPELHWSWRIPHTTEQELKAALPHVAMDSKGDTYCVRQLPNGVRMSTLSLLFAAAFIAGMLARYYPTHWLSLLGRQKGDISLPLLRETLKTVESRYPELVLTELAG
jgi:YaaC-like Protein